MIYRLRLPQTLRARLTLGFLILLLGSAGVVTLILARQTANSELKSQERIGASIIYMIAPALQGMIGGNDVYTLDGYVSRAAADPAIAAIRVTDAGGARLFEHVADEAPAAWYTRLLLPTTESARRLVAEIPGVNAPLGQVEVTLSNAPLNTGLRQIITRGLAITIGLVLAAFLLVHVLLARVMAPLKPLTEWAREFSRGNWKPGIELRPSSSREIQELNQAFTDGSAAMRHYINSLSEARELFEHSESQLRKLIGGMHEILFELDRDGHIVFLNAAWERLTGFAIEDSVGKSLSDFLLDEDVIRDFSPARLSNLHEKSREICVRTAAGKRLWVSLEADAQTDSDGNFTGVIGTLGDITKSVELNRLLSRYQDELYHMSVTDPLTGLYNRRHFDTQLEVILSDHLSQGRSVCLLLIDLDGFKFINDTYGHPFGDEVLRTTAQLLKQQVRRNDYVARLAGDEFAMVLKNTSLENATRIAQKLHTQISQTRVPLPVGSMQLQSSIGVAAAPTHGRNAQDLVSAADVALYHSKRGGRNRIEVLAPDVSQAMMSIFSQGFQLRNALEQGNIHPAFQPICSMGDGKPVAYEVLARMRINDTVIQAKDFIAVAEELGLTRDVDLHIIRTALAATPMHRALFLNVDLSSFNDRDFVRELEYLLAPACAAGRQVTIEITEREAIPLTDTLHQDINRLRALGCKLALDDFGSGYSTYYFLNQFRPDYLKIEGSFVRGMLDNEADRKIVMHIHELAQSFGMQTIAESVENEATRNALRSMGISNAQGLLYGAPELSAA